MVVEFEDLMRVNRRTNCSHGCTRTSKEVLFIMLSVLRPVCACVVPKKLFTMKTCTFERLFLML